MMPEPDFERVLKAIRHKEPDRVPLGELQIDPPIIEAYLGRKIEAARDEIKVFGLLTG